MEEFCDPTSASDKPKCVFEDTQSAHSLCKVSHAMTGDGPDGTIGWTAKERLVILQKFGRETKERTPDYPYILSFFLKNLTRFSFPSLKICPNTLDYKLWADSSRDSYLIFTCSNYGHTSESTWGNTIWGSRRGCVVCSRAPLQPLSPFMHASHSKIFF
jgi:hypothetical protein